MSAVTRVRLLEKTRQFGLLELRLMTGRTHQIRVHLAHAGYPVLGDDKYGDFELNRGLAKQGVQRLFLHARRLSFKHPLDGNRINLESSMPKDIQGFLELQFALPADHL